MVQTSPAQFVREVRQEVNKVAWPKRKETVTTSVMVFIMAFVSALFFLFVDTLVSHAVHFLLNLGG